MDDSRSERRLFAALACIGLIGLLMRVWASSDPASGLNGLASPACSDVLLFFGGVGGAGLVCSAIFGLARTDRTHFWVFLTGVVGAVILFIQMA